MNCRDFFDSVKDELKPCKVLQGHPEETQVAWEHESASVYSPCPVKDVEMLARQVVDPTHYDTVTGTIKPTFFDDASGIGASCHRVEYTDLDQVREFTMQRVTQINQNPPSTGPRTAIGYTPIFATEVRSIMVTNGDQSRRGAAVYDTAKSDDNSHADICQLVSGSQEGRSVRAQLFMLAADRLVKF